MRYSHVIWDFNGTIFDDVEAGMNSENVILKRRNMPLIQSVDHYKNIFLYPIKDYYIALGHDFEKEDFEIVAHEWVELYLNFSKSSKLHDGIKEVLSKIKSKGIKQIILSATELEMLKGQVNGLGITEYFDEIIGLDNICGTSKVEIATEWIKKENPKKAVLIGDTTHDFDVSRAIGVDCILVASGHQNKERLMDCGVPVYENILDLLQSKFFEDL